MNKIFLPLASSIILGMCLTINTPTLSSKITAAEPKAKVTDVEVTGEPENYTFAVTVASPDTGCDLYADWWEVITPEGELIYRRVLLHSHVDEQPFKRTGGTVAIPPEREVIVRVHMSADGYSNLAQQGTVSSGFNEVTLPEGFAQDLAAIEPLPENCAY